MVSQKDGVGVSSNSKINFWILRNWGEGRGDQIQIFQVFVLAVSISHMQDLVFGSDLMSLDNFWNPMSLAVAPYSEIMKRSSGGRWRRPPEGVARATAVMHKLTQELSRPILVPSLRPLKPP